MDPNTVQPIQPPPVQPLDSSSPAYNNKLMQGSNYLLILFLIIISAGAGFFAGKSYSGSKNSLPITQVNQASTPKQNPIFNSQTATIQGQILKVSGSNLTVKGSIGQSGDFAISPKVVIYKLKPGTSSASASSDLKLIETGKQVLIVLELKDNVYQVISISPLPPPPTNLK